VGRPDSLTRHPLTRVAVSLAALSLLLGGCSTTSLAAAPDPAASGSTVPGPSATSAAPAREEVERPAPGPARQGTRAPSQVDRFVPTALVLPGKERADVVPVATVDGELAVPKHIDDLGWWDGSAWLGDPFGATVIAGHVDSATEGIGFFAQLLGIEVGQRVSVLGADGQRQTYTVTSVRTVAQNALDTDSHALDQNGDHRLVLITCTGAWTPGRGYASNLVVTAEKA
jgi:LPXTG-site transpeptidase (sortase) family protein